MNVLTYAAQCESWWRNFVSEIGYTPQTTFFSDLSIAECWGVKGIKDT